MSPKSRVANHLHRYKKVNISNSPGREYFVYKCQKPACSHYISIKLAEGKLCECNRCLEPMIMSKIQLTGSNGGPMAKPHCNDCIERKKKDDVATISEFLEGTKVSTDPN